MVHLMARQQVRNRIPVLMPPEATVANKTGNWEAAAHDVAIVYGPRSTFVIALLSDGIADFDGLYLAMATAARNVYDLANDPSFGSSSSPALPRSLVASYQVAGQAARQQRGQRVVVDPDPAVHVDQRGPGPGRSPAGRQAARGGTGPAGPACGRAERPGRRARPGREAGPQAVRGVRRAAR